MLYSLVFLLFFNTSDATTKTSRPDGEEGSHILEFTLGVVDEEGEIIEALGVDFEYFIPGTHHHLAIGVATDYTFGGPENTFSIGPLISGYYKHIKLSFSSSAITDFEGGSDWKSRLLLGYEFVLQKKGFILVPALFTETISSHENYGATLGIAKEF